MILCLMTDSNTQMKKPKYKMGDRVILNDRIAIIDYVVDIPGGARYGLVDENQKIIWNRNMRTFSEKVLIQN